MTPTYLVAWMYVLVIVFSACTYAPRERERKREKEREPSWVARSLKQTIPDERERIR